MNSFATYMLCKLFNYYRKFNLLLFSLFFHPYYYRISKYGNIKKYRYISHLYTETITDDELFITYECDTQSQIFNRIIHKDTLRIPHDSKITITLSDNMFSSYLNSRTKITFNPDYTNFVFTNIILKINDKEFTIYLRTQDYNFYFVGNKLDYTFIRYYVLNILKSNIFSYFYRNMYDLLYIKRMINHFSNDTHIIPYTLTIIDHQFKMLTLNEWDTITFNKKDYVINKIT
jgi:hypothetical protein